MKRNKIIIFIAVLMMMFIPSIAKADMGAPGMHNFYVVITNKDGAKTKDSDGKSFVIPFDTKVKVYFEMYSKKEKIYYYDVEYKNNDYRIKATDTKLFDEKKVPDNGLKSKCESDCDLYVFRDDVKMFKGPSIAYGEVEKSPKIPVGTILTKSEDEGVWSHVSYDGVDGWVYSYPYDSEYAESLYEFKCGVAGIFRSPLYVTTDNVKLTKDPYGKEDTGVKVKKDSIIYSRYYLTLEPHKMTVFVNYNGTKGWMTYETFGNDALPEEDLIGPNYYKINLKKGTTVYSDYDCTKKETTIDANKYIVKYSNFHYSGSGEMPESYYDNPQERLYVKYDGEHYGWIYVYKNDFDSLDDKVTPDKEDSDPVNYTDKDEPKEEPKSEDSKKEDEKKSDEEKDNNIIIYAIVGAIGLAVVVIVTIIIINSGKKKKAKKVVESEVVAPVENTEVETAVEEKIEEEIKLPGDEE